MKQKKVPLRTCIVTKEALPKKELLRIVKTPEGNFILDFTGKLNGRGAYIKDSEEVMKMCVKTKALNRAFKENISQEIYNKLLGDFLGR